MLKTFIDNPVLSTVISIIIVILGVLGLVNLPISQYPDIAPPTVQVTANYPGANAEVMMKSVIIPLEEQINGVEKMTYMTSKASNDGSAVITVNFEQGADPDLAAINVQNRVAKANGVMPPEVIRSGVTTTKMLNSWLIGFFIYSENKDYDSKFLDNYMRINIVPELKRISGVADVQMWSLMDYSMRIWLKPDVMATYGLVPDDIVNALADQNLEAAPGKIGENSSKTFEYVLKYTGRLEEDHEFEEIVLKATENGQILRLKDVAEVELGAVSYAFENSLNGFPTTGGAVMQTAGSNAHEINQQIVEFLNQAQKDFPPGVKWDTYLNTNNFLDASISKLVKTLVEAFLLVFIMVYIFLQDFRSTLIPAIAVPVAIVGTFFFLNLFGYTLNLLTLFALVLAIGIVVDDAIVVVEAVHAKLDQGAKSPRLATLDAMHEISTAIISITLIMSAVFIPVTFIKGSAGVFYQQFGITLAVAIIISAINALTLSPALCALLLKPHHIDPEEKKKGFLNRFFTAFNAGFKASTKRYIHAVKFLIKRKWLALGSIALFTAILIFFMKTTPTGFVPNEDSGAIFGDVILPPASTLEQTEKVLKEIDSIILSIPEVKISSTLSGMNLLSGNGGSYGAVFIALKPWNERKNKDQDINSLIAKMFEKTSHIKSANIIFFAAPTLQGFGNTSGFEIQLLDKTGGTYADFEGHVNNFMTSINQRPEVMYAATPYNTNLPQYKVKINVPLAKETGVDVSAILKTLQGYFGGMYASDFNRFGKQYKVFVQSNPDQRAQETDLEKIYVRNNEGLMAPISSFVTLERTSGPEFINRFNLYTSAFVNGAPNAGYSTGDAIRAIEEVAVETLPRGVSFDYSGLTREEILSGNQTIIIFILSLIFVYFLLSAQYKSYILPFAVLLSLPFGLSGAFLFARIAGLDNNIFLQISLIMLIGLLAKNAILIVEFSLQRRHHGMSLVRAAISGAEARLRPILMTSFAFIFGLLPLMFSSGVGALSNRSIGTASVGGMLIGTILGVFIIPILFVVFQAIHEKVSGKPNVSVSKNTVLINE